MTPLAPRRERQRAATIAEIKQAARDQVALGGVAAISLRGVARAMGMTPSALYRYFDSHDVLITELCADAFGSLADTLEAAFDAAVDEPDQARRWLLLARAYRHWAHENEPAYALLFGPRTLELDKSGRCGAEMHRATGVLFRCMIEQMGGGAVDPSHLDEQLKPELRARLVDWGVDEGAPISAAGLAGCLIVWTQLHGFLSLELFGHLPPTLGQFDDLFDQQMLDVIVRIGYRHPIDIATTAAPSPADWLAGSAAPTGAPSAHPAR
ncbi:MULTISPECIES: TetR/AcrR family transcriptional regulator [unclassified Pseudofrankia]|uniref:TetR/AcrR family transcriptional regulator n=1 Tax=unclassified Pseudofrankia TaxID=2994372 RepID=UPI0008D8DE61|nr:MULTISPECIES: TetR/AcrR family transcriptional regulator [unclassified Pseudofrankia]MDT3443697.1 TetR/AcrR family transcriptional regulator [Pseudofrankia sp. BMG5.37]OHV42907.1 TetR family transcriptional regulator [Pseudofrankia sp. BMG5.36]